MEIGHLEKKHILSLYLNFKKEEAYKYITI